MSLLFFMPSGRHTSGFVQNFLCAPYSFKKPWDIRFECPNDMRFTFLLRVFFKRNLTNDHRRIILTVKTRNHFDGKSPHLFR